jgi:glutathione synthase/RimK-type ligase-like ATP-grasp enzyme
LPDAFPIIVRPVDSHAGAGLEKLETAAEMAAYLAGQAGESFYVQPFVDYAGADGRFRKLRVALVAGRPFIVHMAVSEHWMVHYLNAGMADDAGKRAEEAAMMADFDTGFAARHGAAFAAIAAAFGLDYVALDCAEDRQGRLLVFEADTAMIVHDMDPPDLYPYKAPAMAKLFAAFQALIATRLS